MKENKPTCKPDSVYCVKQTCAELGISPNTLRTLRIRGHITPINTSNKWRPKYLGQSIIECWNKLVGI